MTQLLQFAWVEADKRANNQVGTVLLDTLYTQCIFRSACAIADPAGPTVVVTGGDHSPNKVSRYNRSGWVEDLQDMTVGRTRHECAGYMKDGELVSRYSENLLVFVRYCYCVQFRSTLLLAETQVVRPRTPRRSIVAVSGELSELFQWLHGI